MLIMYGCMHHVKVVVTATGVEDRMEEVSNKPVYSGYTIPKLGKKDMLKCTDDQLSFQGILLTMGSPQTSSAHNTNAMASFHAMVSVD